mmetsp:Transcript_24530/g.92667  ORF Transcript_24530/g.92667 Transcript_24530/m.92667 type:complete len:595 (-) Transcript_24530:202-1986(-)
MRNPPHAHRGVRRGVVPCAAGGSQLSAERAVHAVVHAAQAGRAERRVVHQPAAAVGRGEASCRGRHKGRARDGEPQAGVVHARVPRAPGPGVRAIVEQAGGVVHPWSAAAAGVREGSHAAVGGGRAEARVLRRRRRCCGCRALHAGGRKPQVAVPVAGGEVRCRVAADAAEGAPRSQLVAPVVQPSPVVAAQQALHRRGSELAAEPRRGQAVVLLPLCSEAGIDAVRAHGAAGARAARGAASGGGARRGSREAPARRAGGPSAELAAHGDIRPSGASVAVAHWRAVGSARQRDAVHLGGHADGERARLVVHRVRAGQARAGVHVKPADGGGRDRARQRAGRPQAVAPAHHSAARHGRQVQAQGGRHRLPGHVGRAVGIAVVQAPPRVVGDVVPVDVVQRGQAGRLQRRQRHGRDGGRRHCRSLAPSSRRSGRDVAAVAAVALRRPRGGRVVAGGPALGPLARARALARRLRAAVPVGKVARAGLARDLGNPSNDGLDSGGALGNVQAPIYFLDRRQPELALGRVQERHRRVGPGDPKGALDAPHGAVEAVLASGLAAPVGQEGGNVLPAISHGLLQRKELELVLRLPVCRMCHV